jgi:iron complex transport system substrate-binding protein
VSLVPSATEIAFALGLGDAVVGVTFECDEPTEARMDREIVVTGLDTAGLDPAAIDDLVRTTVAAGEPLYQVDVDAFARCDPDLVLAQDLCRVCALPSGDADAALNHLGCHAPVVTLDPTDLAGVLTDIRAVGEAAGIGEHAAAFVDGAADLAASVVDDLPIGVSVWALDANGIIVRPGPRLVDGVETIAAILHPDAGWASDPILASARRL